MRMISWRLLTIVLLAHTASTSLAQIGEQSGKPGDGIPDFYYFAVDGSRLMSSGSVHRPAGTMIVDTDGADLVAWLIGGPDVSRTDCYLCDGMNMPGEDALAGSSTWTVVVSGAT